MQDKAVETFQNGKYTDTVRDVYEDLLCMGVSAENCEKVVREVLEEMAGVTVGRLPKETFARSMYLEARRMAQMQVNEELVDKWDEKSRTLLSDGTSKWHHKYLTYQIKKDDGKFLVLGRREVAGGDAETQLNVEGSDERSCSIRELLARQSKFIKKQQDYCFHPKFNVRQMWCAKEI